MFGSTIRKIPVCLLLACLGLVAVRGIWMLGATGEPYVDFSNRVKGDVAARTARHSADNLRFAVATMVTAEATFSTYRELVQRICRDVGRGEAFIVRPTYSEVRRSLEQGALDVAFVCTGTYVHSLPGKRVKLLVQPQFKEGLEYRCLIIVPAASNYHSLDDLRGQVMALTDPESNTGCLVPRAVLAEKGHQIESFFGKLVFTGSHDRSIQAVAISAVDAAAIDALVWQSKLAEDGSLADRIRIIWRSEPFGPPPVVVPADIDPNLETALRKAFLDLHQDSEGRRILSAIGIENFILPRQAEYEAAVSLLQNVRPPGAELWP